MKKIMRSFLSMVVVCGLLTTGCGENSFDRHSNTEENVANDSVSGFQAGEGIESIADPNAANTKRTPVPLDTVVVDTTTAAE